MDKASVSAARDVPPEAVLRKIRIPHIQRAILTRAGISEEVFVVDLGLCGVFVEREEPLPVGDEVNVVFALPGNDVPLQARCRVAWWHPPGAPLVSKALPAGLGLEFLTLSLKDLARLRDHILAYYRRAFPVRRFLPHWPPSEEEGEAL